MNAPSGAEARRLRGRLTRIAQFMDNSIRVPVIGKRIGWDAVIGLVPGVGDIAGALISAYIVVAAWRLGVPAGGLLRMLGNIGIETVGGALPLLGDIFDMAFKANVRNVALIDRYLGVASDSAPAQEAQAARGPGMSALLVGAVIALVAGAAGVGLLALTI